MAQRDPLAIFAYGIGILPLIKRLKAEFPDITQPQYADDSGSLGTFANIGLYFNQLKRIGPGCDYYPKPSKIIMIVHPDNLEARKRFVLSHIFEVCTCARYLGGFIGDDDSRRGWFKVHTKKWERTINNISETAGGYSHGIYTAVVRLIQSQWIFLQCITKNKGYAFAGVQNLLS